MTIKNRSRRATARLVVTQQKGVSQLLSEPLVGRILEQPITRRPGQIKLRSLWPYEGIGYEWVEVRRLVVRHHHQAKEPGQIGSLAIVLVISGEGEFGIASDNGPGEVMPVSSGSVLLIPPGHWHGFKVRPGKRLLIVSLQIPEIEEKYTFAANLGIPEFRYSF